MRDWLIALLAWAGRAAPAPAPAPRTQPEALRPRRARVSPETLGRSRLAAPRDPLETFRPARPAPGVVPQGVAPMALDENLGAWTSGLSETTGGLGWLGIPFLAELSQRSEYRQIVETIAKEMTRRWIKVTAQGDEDKTGCVAQIEDDLKKYQVRRKFRRLAELDGFFGRGHLYVDTGQGGDREVMKVPLILDRRTFEPGSLRDFRVVEPLWTYPGVYDASDPLAEDFYAPRTWYVFGKELHRTRLMTLVSREVPDLLKPAYQFGGVSLSQLAKPYVDNWLRTRQSVSDLIHSFSTMILKTDMSVVLQDGGGQELFDRIELYNNLRDNRGLMALDKEREDLANVVTPLGTLDHLQAQAQEQLASVSHTPLIVLLGVTPSGLNASSDGELQVWAQWVRSMQEHLFDDALDRVIRCIQVNRWGEVDPDIGFDYEPLRELSDAERSAARKQDADTHAVYVNAGVIGPDEVRQALSEDEASPYAGVDLSSPPPAPPPPPQAEEDPLGGPGQSPGGPEGAPRGDAPAGDDGAPGDDLSAGVAAAIEARRAEQAYENWWRGAQDEDAKPVERRRYGDLQIGIETRRGEARSGGVLAADYGYIMRTTGADGDRVDVFVGPLEPTQLPAFVLEQHHLGGRPDEHKVFIGFQQVADALGAYDRGFDGSGPERRGAVYTVPFDDLRAWLRDHPMRVSQVSADYGPGEPDGDRCGACRYFGAPHACSRVVGMVDATGWCRLFTGAG